MTDKIHFADEDCVWIDGRQFISLKRVGKMLKEKKMTNADRIRNMGDEELASFFRDYVACDDCPVEPKKCGKGWIPCKVVALSWLKKEVKDE